MILEPDDLFVVIRGIKLNTSPLWSDFLNNFSQGEEWKTNTKTEKEPSYDRSYQGLVFKTLCQIDDIVACEIVWSSKSWMQVGEKFSLNLTEIEIQAVPPQYLKVLKN